MLHTRRRLQRYYLWQQRRQQTRRQWDRRSCWGMKEQHGSRTPEPIAPPFRVPISCADTINGGPVFRRRNIRVTTCSKDNRSASSFITTLRSISIHPSPYYSTVVAVTALFFIRFLLLTPDLLITTSESEYMAPTCILSPSFLFVWISIIRSESLVVAEKVWGQGKRARARPVRPSRYSIGQL
jgi:hypothetical protein